MAYNDFVIVMPTKYAGYPYTLITPMLSMKPPKGRIYP